MDVHTHINIYKVTQAETKDLHYKVYFCFVVFSSLVNRINFNDRKTCFGTSKFLC